MSDYDGSSDSALSSDLGSDSDTQSAEDLSESSEGSKEREPIFSHTGSYQTDETEQVDKQLHGIREDTVSESCRQKENASIYDELKEFTEPTVCTEDCNLTMSPRTIYDYEEAILHHLVRLRTHSEAKNAAIWTRKELDVDGKRLKKNLYEKVKPKVFEQAKAAAATYCLQFFKDYLPLNTTELIPEKRMVVIREKEYDNVRQHGPALLAMGSQFDKVSRAPKTEGRVGLWENLSSLPEERDYALFDSYIPLIGLVARLTYKKDQKRKIYWKKKEKMNENDRLLEKLYDELPKLLSDLQAKISLESDLFQLLSTRHEFWPSNRFLSGDPIIDELKKVIAEKGTLNPSDKKQIAYRQESMLSRCKDKTFQNCFKVFYGHGEELKDLVNELLEKMKEEEVAPLPAKRLDELCKEEDSEVMRNLKTFDRPLQSTLMFVEEILEGIDVEAMKKKIFSELSLLLTSSDLVSGHDIVRLLFSLCRHANQSSVQVRTYFTADEQTKLDAQLIDAIPHFHRNIREKALVLGEESLMRLRTVRSGIQFLSDDLATTDSPDLYLAVSDFMESSAVFVLDKKLRIFEGMRGQYDCGDDCEDLRGVPDDHFWWSELERGDSERKMADEPLQPEEEFVIREKKYKYGENWDLKSTRDWMAEVGFMRRRLLQDDKLYMKNNSVQNVDIDADLLVISIENPAKTRLLRVNRCWSRVVAAAHTAISSLKSFSTMIDCHCHLVDKKFKNDVDEIISRAQAAGIQKAVVLPEYPSQFEAVLELKRSHPKFVVAGIGVHPIQKRNKSVRMEHILTVEGTLARHQKQIGCIGEVGLDFTTDLFKVSEEDRLVQERVFRQHIHWAREYDLPLNCHSRTAEEDTIRILMDEGCPRALLHAYGGPVGLAVRAAEAGLFFSIPPCFSLSEKARILVEALPLSQLVLETDSPVLGVERGVRNEPANCLISAEFIAKVKGIALEEVKDTTTENARRLFGILF